MTKYLKISIWNANGLAQHSQELKTFIYNHDIDIMLVSETHFTKKSYLKIPNYVIYDTQHPDGTAHGGSALIIKSKIKHHETVSFKKDFLQATSVIIEDWHGPLTVSAVYFPPKHAVKKEEFEQYFKQLGNRFLAGGDYNAKHTHWGSRLINPKGRQLLMAINDNNYKHLSTGEPTYWPTDRSKIPDLVDFCVTKGIPKESQKAESCFDLSSDHSPVLIELSTTILIRETPPKLGSKNTNWDIFREIIDEELKLNIPLKSRIDIENAVQNLNKIIQAAVWSSTPTNTTTYSRQVLPTIIKQKIVEKRRLRKIWQNTRCPQDKTKLNQITRQLKDLLNNHKNDSIQKYLKGLTATEATEYALWKATQKINRPQLLNPPIRKENNQWAKSDEEKAETFACHLEKVFQPNPPNNDNDIEAQLLTDLESPYQLELPAEKFTIAQVNSIIKTNLNPRKAPGYDLITGKVLQELPRKGVVYLTQIYNAILRIGHFPMVWKVAQIILILKPGKPAEEVKSYRPISLLPAMSKVLEKLILSRIEPVLTARKIIPTHQFGFRPKHATIEQIHRVCTNISQTLEDKKYCSAAFLDISQAFDKVWHTGLLYKLKKILPLSYFLTLKSYLEDRHFLVKYQDAHTSIFPVKSGVPQGSVLGPVLYLLYTADLPTTNGVVTATYADDTALLSMHEDPNQASQILQMNLNNIQTWLKKWRIQANATKSVHVTFTNRKGNCPPVTLNSQQLNQQQDVKYLGMHIDRKLTWKKHIFMKRKQLGLKLNGLYWLIGRKSQLCLQNKILIYKTILKPIWSYGIQLWGTASNSNLEILERFQSKTLRVMTNAPWYVPNNYIRNDLQIPTVKEEISNFAQKYQQRLLQHPNNLAKSLRRIPARRRLKRYIVSDLPTRF